MTATDACAAGNARRSCSLQTDVLSVACLPKRNEVVSAGAGWNRSGNINESLCCLPNGDVGDHLVRQRFDRYRMVVIFQSDVNSCAITGRPNAVRQVSDDHVLSKASVTEAIYSGAYIMPSGSAVFGTTRKHRAHLKLLMQMMEDEVALRIAGAKSMLEVFTLLRSYPMIGDFLAYQYATDLDYSTLTNFSRNGVCCSRAGAKGGISKCFESLGGLSESDLIRVVDRTGRRRSSARGIQFKSLWGRPLQLIDCQNLFCEVDKYSRVHHPEITGMSARTRIKQKFRATEAAVEYWYPPKWGLNERIAMDQKESGDETSRVSA